MHQIERKFWKILFKSAFGHLSFIYDSRIGNTATWTYLAPNIFNWLSYLKN